MDMQWKEQQALYEERFRLARERIEEIAGEQDCSELYRDYFKRGADFLLCLLNQWDFVISGKIKSATLQELQRRNKAVYAEVMPQNYAHSYANPEVARKQFGEAMGRVLCVLYAELRGAIGSVYEKELEGVLIRLELFLACYQQFVMGQETCKPEEITEMLYWYVSDYSETRMERRVATQVEPEEAFAQKIVLESDLSDPRFLYQYGEYVGENALQTLAFLNCQPKERIALMAKTFTEGYQKGFAVTGRDITRKKSVNIRYALGFEPMIREAMASFEKMGLRATMYRAGSSLFLGHSVNKNGFFGDSPSKQFDFDHREDLGLILDAKLVNRKLECLKESYEVHKEAAGVFGGPAVVEIFGEADFLPENKDAAIRYDQKQQKLCVEYATKAGQITNQYIKEEERSFTIIAFPIPEIGPDFEAIFQETIQINTLDYALYQSIQQTLIDALDLGSAVYIEGSGENRTKLTVQLHHKQDPKKETNFENCVADVNIPVGEVFTSPRLTGTNGLLHVTRVFLNGMEYQNLWIELEEGRTRNYGCSNFPTEEAGRKLIQDEILHHHESLPIGEFAIGTNTTAYVAARRYGIESKLPILIAEKTGPHFALGDTCYARSEEVPMYNPDGKEMVAKENECSRLRDKEPEKAYFHCHTDITIPYDELGEVTVLCEDGSRISLIKDGRFVLKGTEMLNEPLETRLP